MTGGSWFRGRPLAYDRERAEAEQSRQRWVSRQVAIGNGIAERGAASVAELEALAALDPAQEYERHRANYVRSGSRAEFALMLEYVQ